jgi:hypothetical protein
VKVKAHLENGVYVLKDESGTVYGRYDKKQVAEQAAIDWNRYYEAPLVFTVTGSI